MSDNKLNYTIIIPHHNIPNLLVRCLNSIPRRDDIQIIVVDDNSSPQIVNFEKFPGLYDSSVEVYFTKDGKGAGYARNVGLQHAKGKWLLFADADDFFCKNAFEIIDSFINSDADVILFKADSVNSDTLESANRNKTTNNSIDKYIAGNISEKDVALFFWVPWCKLINREYVLRNNFNFDEIPVSNDVMFATKVACNTNKIIVSSKCIYCNTFRSDSLWCSKKNLDIRVCTHIRHNNYLLEHGYKNVIPPILFVHKLCKHSFKTYIQCLWILIMKGVIIQGIPVYLKKRINKKI